MGRTYRHPKSYAAYNDLDVSPDYDDERDDCALSEIEDPADLPDTSDVRSEYAWLGCSRVTVDE